MWMYQTATWKPINPTAHKISKMIPMVTSMMIEKLLTMLTASIGCLYSFYSSFKSRQTEFMQYR